MRLVGNFMLPLVVPLVVPCGGSPSGGPGPAMAHGCPQVLRLAKMSTAPAEKYQVQPAVTVSFHLGVWWRALPLSRTDSWVYFIGFFFA